VFRRLGDRLVGIRNGIDQFQWDPATDPDIAAHFDPDDLRGKAVCKAALQKAWNLPQRERVPLFAMSARLVSQKGVELILGSTCLRELDAQFVFLGEGEPRYEVALRDVAREHPGRVALNTGFTDALEHRLLAGADFLLMPSLYEPCGLTQMRAQLYGALPLARRVGGLADTIVDGETGILFDEYTPAAFDAAVRRAVRLYQDRAAFVEHARRAMRNDFSWSAPGAAYVEAYRRAITARAQRRPPGSPDEPPGSPGADEPARSRFRSMRDASISKVDLQAAR
jgi:starch synthase